MAPLTLTAKIRQYTSTRREQLNTQLAELNGRLQAGQLVRGDWEQLRIREVVLRELEELTEYLGN